MDYLLSYWSIGGFLAIIGLASWWFWPFILSFLSTPLGRKLAAIGATIVAFWLIAIKIFNAGRKQELDKLKDNSNRLEQERIANDKERKSLPPDKLVEQSKPWLHDNK